MDTDRNNQEVDEFLEQVDNEQNENEENEMEEKDVGEKRKGGRQAGEKKSKKKKQDVGFKQIDPLNQGIILLFCIYL
jgi:hypothetical protein